MSFAYKLRPAMTRYIGLQELEFLDFNMPEA